MATDGLTRSEELVSKARAGEKLETEDRRTAMAYLMATEPDLSGMDMARLFQISEGMVRKDKDCIRKMSAEEISKDDVGLVISDIRRTYERFNVGMEKSLKKAKEGTGTYINHLKMMMDYQLKVVEALQSLGYYPKNLGHLSKTVFKFKAIVGKDESVSVHNLDEMDTKALELRQLKALPPAKQPGDTPEDRQLRADLEAEFCEVPSDSQVIEGTYVDATVKR